MPSQTAFRRKLGSEIMRGCLIQINRRPNSSESAARSTHACLSMTAERRGLPLRHDRIDNFWFALLHELAHVALHLKPESPVFLDDLDRTNPEGVEAEADAMAQEALIPTKIWAAAKVRQTRSADDAVALADEIGVHPANVAGRLRHEEKNFRLLSQLIGKTGQVGNTLAL